MKKNNDLRYLRTFALVYMLISLILILAGVVLSIVEGDFKKVALFSFGGLGVFIMLWALANEKDDEDEN